MQTGAELSIHQYTGLLTNNNSSTIDQLGQITIHGNNYA